jgi:hypothetical protein
MCRDHYGISSIAIRAPHEPGSVGIFRMHHQLERASVAKWNRREVTHVACCQTMNAERLGERHDRTIDKAQAEICRTSVYLIARDS